MALVLATPAATAAWYSYGAHEPDTKYDSDWYSWYDPPGEIKHRVYFNAFTRQHEAAPNPNVGALHTRMETVAAEQHEAILGVWVDCNGDGYVGLAETGAREYHSILLDVHAESLGLPDTSSRCPPAIGPARHWSGEHNYNAWVTELIPVVTERTTDARVYASDDARVWGDAGLPDGRFARPVCALEALPPGSARSSGALLDHADCFAKIATRTTSSQVYRDVIATADASNALGLQLEGEGWAGGSHPLGQQSLGDQNGENAIVAVQDCDEEPLFVVGSVVGGTDVSHWRIHPVDDDVNTDGTVAGTVNQALWGAPFRHETESAEHGNCSYEEGMNSRGFYEALEGDTPDTHGGVKDSVTWYFHSHSQVRASDATVGNAISTDVPTDLGVAPLGPACGELHCKPTGWYADQLTARALPSVFRGDLNDPDTLAFADAHVNTFYARVGVHNLARGLSTPVTHLQSGGAFYGLPFCGSNTGGIHHGWQCDPELWNTRTPHRPEIDIAPGLTFTHRDIDCMDGQVVENSGVALLPAGYGENTCG